MPFGDGLLQASPAATNLSTTGNGFLCAPLPATTPSMAPLHVQLDGWIALRLAA